MQQEGTLGRWEMGDEVSPSRRNRPFSTYGLPAKDLVGRMKERVRDEPFDGLAYREQACLCPSSTNTEIFQLVFTKPVGTK